ncbi:hypothetical protein PPERSA_07234 [Pseudocohnilembus persalinus]|uniref:Transmembrane protein n=1 Tax=Pseudocohnilembus persalinus TaxID=266149 RepID=A0A0V0QD68_PSEPJ|nr:hypothetical protein PPERSA_07234 [Pseudocohnilembus persalinus]|eukprot:KRX00037.1 hypothetical protein PPERSA_07234 [Pseudocohnilembus persalinus]
MKFKQQNLFQNLLKQENQFSPNNLSEANSVFINNENIGKQQQQLKQQKQIQNKLQGINQDSENLESQQGIQDLSKLSLSQNLEKNFELDQNGQEKIKQEQESKNTDLNFGEKNEQNERQNQDIFQENNGLLQQQQKFNNQQNLTQFSKITLRFRNTALEETYKKIFIQQNMYMVFFSCFLLGVLYLICIWDLFDKNNDLKQNRRNKYTILFTLKEQVDPIASITVALNKNYQEELNEESEENEEIIQENDDFQFKLCFVNLNAQKNLKIYKNEDFIKFSEKALIKDQSQNLQSYLLEKLNRYNEQFEESLQGYQNGILSFLRNWIYQENIQAEQDFILAEIGNSEGKRLYRIGVLPIFFNYLMLHLTIEDVTFEKKVSKYLDMDNKMKENQVMKDYLQFMSQDFKNLNQIYQNYGGQDFEENRVNLKYLLEIMTNHLFNLVDYINLNQEEYDQLINSISIQSGFLTRNCEECQKIKIRSYLETIGDIFREFYSQKKIEFRTEVQEEEGNCDLEIFTDIRRLTTLLINLIEESYLSLEKQGIIEVLAKVQQDQEDNLIIQFIIKDNRDLDSGDSSDDKMDFNQNQLFLNQKEQLEEKVNEAHLGSLGNGESKIEKMERENQFWKVFQILTDVQRLPNYYYLKQKNFQNNKVNLNSQLGFLPLAESEKAGTLFNSLSNIQKLAYGSKNQLWGSKYSSFMNLDYKQIKLQIEMKTPQKSKQSGSFINKLLYVLLIFGIGFNVYLYLEKSQQGGNQVDIKLTIENGKASADYSTQFIGSQNSRKLANQLQNLDVQKISELELNLALCSLQEEDIVNISEKIQHLKNLKKFRIGLGHNYFGEKAAVQIIRNLGQFNQKLESVSLGFDAVQFNSTQISEIGGALEKMNGQLKELKELNLSFIYGKMGDSGVQKLAESLGGFQGLESLGLNLISNEIKQEGSEALAGLVFRLEQLKNLNISLYANKIGPEGGEALTQPLRNLKQLQSLDLDLFFGNITASGTQVLSESLEQLTQLTSLKVGLEFNYIEQEGAEFLGKALSKLVNLKTLHLNVATKNFGPSGFHEIMMGITKLSKVEDLQIICGVNRVGVSGVNDLKTVVGSLSNLKRLQVDFIENYIGENGAQPFVDALEGLQKVQELDISLAFNDLKQWGSKIALSGLLKMKQVKNLKFSLSQNEIQDEGAMELADIIVKNSAHLEKFTFYFTGTAITKQGVEQMQNKLSGLKNVELIINSVVSDEYLEEQKKEKEQEKKQNDL